MKTKINWASMVLIGAIAVSGSSLAQAATSEEPADECEALKHEFDSANKASASSKEFMRARKQRRKGGDLCSEGKTSEGVAALKLALEDIGIEKN